MYKKKVKGNIQDPYNLNNRIAKFVSFVKNNNYNKYISVPSYRGLTISYLNILA